MLVDCTDLLSNTGVTPMEFASLLRKEIYEKTKCTASAGLGEWEGFLLFLSNNGNILFASDCNLDTRSERSQPVFRVSDHVRHKPSCTATA